MDRRQFIQSIGIALAAVGLIPRKVEASKGLILPEGKYSRAKAKPRQVRDTNWNEYTPEEYRALVLGEPVGHRTAAGIRIRWGERFPRELAADIRASKRQV